MKSISRIIGKNKQLISMLLLFSVFFSVLTYFYLQKIASFGCFDDCNSFMGGYFLLKDKQIFSEFFFNHAPGIAYISFVIQKLSNPQGIYELILYHRISLYLFSYLMGIFLILRFGKVAFLFILVFESTKYFIFGDRFLAENYVVYLLVYIFGICLLKINLNKIGKIDFYISAIFGWAVIFTREPYIPLTFFLLFIFFFGKLNKEKINSIIIFLILTTFTLLNLPIREMINNVYVYNNGIITSEVKEKGGTFKILLISLIYPIYLFFKGNQNLFKNIEQIISIVFLVMVSKFIVIKKYKLVLFIIVSLLISNIRFVTPGEMFYGSYHMVIWYSFIIFSTFFLILNSTFPFRLKTLLIILLLTIPLISLTSKESYVKKTISKTDEFNLSYSNYFVYGQGIKLLSDPSNTLFLEERDDLIYQAADLKTSYKYNMYTGIMPMIKKYKLERDDMFVKNPPDFYYDACLIHQKKQKDPKGFTRILIFDSPSCLLIKNSVLNKIPDQNWQSVSSFGFKKP